LAFVTFPARMLIKSARTASSRCSAGSGSGSALAFTLSLAATRVLIKSARTGPGLASCSERLCTRTRALFPFAGMLSAAGTGTTSQARLTAMLFA
jgi:hypothetical protein